jgi:hypothetical protein
MNAESTVFRSSRPAVVPVPGVGGEGARAAAWLLAMPLRLAVSPLGRRLLVAVALAVVAVASVGYLYDSADRAPAAGTFRPAGMAREAGRAPSGGRTAAAPHRAKRPAGPAEAATAWFAARMKVRPEQVRALQQRRVSDNERQVLVVAEAGGSGMPSRYVTVRRTAAGWKVPW